MATLEKIRSKSVLLVVIIAVALLAFILGDAITNGRNLFGNNTTVAKVGGNKIEFQDYQRKQQEINQQIEAQRRQNPQALANLDNQVIPQQAVEQIIDEMLVNNAVEAVGIKSSPEMLRYYMIELPNMNPNAMTPEMQQLIMSMQQSGLNVRTPEEAYSVIFTPQNYGLTERQVQGFQQAWLALETRYGQLIAQTIYGNLFSNSFKANALDAAAMKKDYAAAANVKVAKMPYGELDEKTYPVSDDEIKKAYEAQKEKYALPEPTKEVCFIAVPVDPSTADRQECSKLEAQVVKELKAGAVSKETRKNGLDIQRHDQLLSDVKNGALKNFLSTAPIDSVAVLPAMGNGFSVAKLNHRSNKVDSVELAYIGVMDQGNLVKRVLEYANSGQPLDSINVRFSADSVRYNAPEWENLYAANMPKNLGLQESLFDSLMNSAGRYIVTQNVQGWTLLQTVTRKSGPKQVVEYETVDYVLHPSDATLAAAREQLQKFVTDNNTASKFAENAQAAGYMPVDLAINPSTPAVPRGYNGFYPDSRALVRWVVMDGKDGQISKIYQSKDPAKPVLYVAAVLDSYKDYVPWTNKGVKEELTAQVRREKAADAMAKKYAKGTVEESAAAMGVEPVEVDMLKSGRFNGTVTDAKVKGRMLGSKKTGKVQTANGDDALYVFVITDAIEEPVADGAALNFEQMFVQGHQLQPSAVLRGNKKVENNVYKFEQAE